MISEKGMAPFHAVAGLKRASQQKNLMSQM